MKRSIGDYFSVVQKQSKPTSSADASALPAPVSNPVVEAEIEPIEVTILSSASSANSDLLSPASSSSSAPSPQFDPPFAHSADQNDIGYFVNKRLSKEEKKRLLASVWKPDSSYKFPSTERYSHGKLEKRKLSLDYFTKFPWLAYSHIYKGLFCLPCVVFAQDEAGKGGHQTLKNLVKEPLTKFSHLTGRDGYLSTHAGRDYHKSAVCKMDSFLLAVSRGVEGEIVGQLGSCHAEKVKENRERLKIIMKTIDLCARSNFPLRGHRDYGQIDTDDKSIVQQEGPFRRLLRFRVESGDVQLEEHLKNSAKNATYISKRIQNELIELMGEWIQKSVTDNAQSAKYWSVLADETPDTAHEEQLSISIRYVHDNLVQEKFLQFVALEKQSAEVLANTLLTTLRKLQLDLSCLVGQGYDGAAAMSGSLGGVQAIVQQEFPAAVYVHCTAHCLNLVLGKACHLTPSVRTAFNTIHDVYGFIYHSTRRAAAFTQCVQDLTESEVQRRKLASLCTTRWASRHDSVSALIDLYRPLVFYLEDLANAGGSDEARRASQLHLLVTSSEFLVCINILNRILSITLNLSTCLQSSKLDLVQAMGMVKLVKDNLKDKLNNLNTFDRLIMQPAARMADICHTKLSLPRRRGIDTAMHPIDYYRDTIYVPYIKQVVAELERRFGPHQEKAGKLSFLIPSFVAESSWADIEPSVQMYSHFLDVTMIAIEEEYNLWRQRWSSETNVELPSSAIEAFASCDSHFYPNIKILLQILATLPVSTATSERSFSTLKRLKTYLRSTMKEDRLNGLALMNIHENMSIDYDQVIDKFAEKSRRTEFVI